MFVLRGLLTAQMIGMSLASVMFAARPPIVLAIFLATTIPFLAIGMRDKGAELVLPMLGWSGAIFLALSIGYVLNPLSSDPPVRVAVVFMVFASGWFARRLIDRKTIMRALILSATAGLVATLVDLYREGLGSYFEDGDRLTGGEESHPNLVGLTMVCLALGITPLANLWLRYGLWGMGFFVSMIVQSRNSLLTLLIVLAIWLWRDFIRKLSLPAICVLLLFGIGTVILKYESIWDMFSKLFMLDNPYRGTGTDLVGRSELWSATWNLFTLYPLFGYGLGQHQVGAGIEMYAHNMYLILLSESGQVGFLGFLTATIVAARGLLRRARIDRLSLALLIILFVYFAYGIFEGRAVNAGNFLSYLFFFAWGYGICNFNEGALVRLPSSSSLEKVKSSFI